MYALLRWWFIFCLLFFGNWIAFNLGAWHYLWQNDKSHLSAVTLVVFQLITLWIGQLTYAARHGDQDFQKHLPTLWFGSELCMGLGMIGTLIGFLMLLSGALGQPINTADTAAMTKLISHMGVGFATAALTTLVGLACSLLIKLQLLNLEYQLET